MSENYETMNFNEEFRRSFAHVAASGAFAAASDEHKQRFGDAVLEALTKQVEQAEDRRFWNMQDTVFAAAREHIRPLVERWIADNKDALAVMVLEIGAKITEELKQRAAERFADYDVQRAFDQAIDAAKAAMKESRP